MEISWNFVSPKKWEPWNFMSGIPLANLYKQLKYHCSDTGRPAIFTGHQASFNESIELIVSSSIMLLSFKIKPLFDYSQVTGH